MNSAITAKTAESDLIPPERFGEVEPYELPGDRRARILKEFWIRSFNRWLDLLVRFIYWLAAKRVARAEARAKRIAASRVIDEAMKCRGCGVQGERSWRGEVLRPSVRMQFERIQPSAQDQQSTGAIKINCLRCNAEWYEPTVQPSQEWVVQKQPRVSRS